DAVAMEAKKGFDLLFIGLEDMTNGSGRIADRVNAAVAGFEGPIALAISAFDMDFDHDRPATVLIPVNGTDASRRGAELAFAILPPSAARCIAVHVAELPAGADAPKAEGAVLDDIIALGDRHGFAVSTAVHRDTDPAEAISREAATRAANFLVI